MTSNRAGHNGSKVSGSLESAEGTLTGGDLYLRCGVRLNQKGSARATRHSADSND